MIANINVALNFIAENTALVAVIAGLIVALTEFTKDCFSPFTDKLAKYDQLNKVIAVIWSVLLFAFPVPVWAYIGLLIGIGSTYGYKGIKKIKK